MKQLYIAGIAAIFALTMCSKPVSMGGESTEDGQTPEMEEFSFRTVDYMRREWGSEPYPGGYENAMSKQTMTVSGMNWMKKETEYKLDRWGGNPDLEVTQVVSTNTAGFWRTGKVGNRWYFINPDGHATIMHGLNGVTPDPARDGSTQETQKWYNTLFGGNAEVWADYAGKEVLDRYAFNCFAVSPRRPCYLWDYLGDKELGILRSPTGSRQNAQVENLFLLRSFSWDYNSITGTNFSTKDYNIFVLLFHPACKEYIENLALEATAPFKESKNLVGYYTDNELAFNAYQNNSLTKGIELKHFLTLKDRYTGEFEGARKFAQDFMKEQGVEPSVNNITEPLRDLFRKEVARVYYKTVSEAIRKADPNHLVLGSRLFNQSMYNQYTVQACAEFCDVVTVNYYNYWTPTVEYCQQQLGTWIDKPFMVTEFYTKGEKASYGAEPYENIEGAGWIVRDQKSRGWYYQNFTIGLMRMGNCIGWQWFEFMDNYGKSSNGTVWTGSNKGVVSSRFELYEDCLELMRELNLNIYQIIDYFDTRKGK